MQVIGIGSGIGNDHLKSWQYDYGVTHALLSDEDENISSQFGTTVSVILDHTMTVQYISSGEFDDAAYRSMLTALAEPLVKIDHMSLSNTEDDQNPHEFDIAIRSSGSFSPGNRLLYWNTDGSDNYTSVALQDTGNNQYTVSLSNQMKGTTVYYYVYAESDNGFYRTHPFNAPGEVHMFDILEDLSPPIIDHTPIGRWRDDRDNLLITAMIRDELDLDYVRLYYRTGGGTPEFVAMSSSEGGYWTASLPLGLATGESMAYRIEVADSSENGNIALHPSSGYHTLAVIEPFPALVIDLDGNANSGPIIYNTLTEIGIQAEYVTTIPDHLELYQSLWISLGIGDNYRRLSFDEQFKLYETLLDHSNVYLEGGNAWVNTHKFQLHSAFQIGGGSTPAAGENDAGPISGMEGAITEGLIFDYTGDNEGMDRLRAKTGATVIFNNAAPEYINAVSYIGDTYKTIGSGFEFGGLADGTGNSTRATLMQNYADFFGVSTETTCTELGTSLWMPARSFAPGDPVSVKAYLCNPDAVSYENVPLFVILDVFGEYYFWPSFTTFDYETVQLESGLTEVIVLPEFAWPANTGTVNGIVWYSAMTDPDIQNLFGTMSSWEFGWSE